MRNLVAALIVRFVDRLSQPARASARAVGEIERAQRMAQRAGAQWSRGLDDLDERLNRLASASLVTDGLDRAGQAMMRPLRAATASAADFNAGMTGIGITAQLTDRQLQPMRRTIIETAADLGALPATVQATFGAVLAEGVYRTEAELSRAGVAVARFQRLQAAMGEPLSDQEAGSWSSALGSSLGMRADQLDRANAMANRSAQQGGVSGASLARALPAQTGALVGLNFANERGLADLLTANQLAKRLAGSSDQATNNVSNLMAALASPEVMRRFDSIGINLEAQIKRGVAAGRSPLETLARITREATSADQFRIGELFGDRQARDGLMALVQNFDDFQRMSRELQGADVLTGYMADLDRAAAGPAASFSRYQSSVARAGIATGTILAPAVSLAADALGRIANWMSQAAESGSPLARVAVYAVAGFAGLAVAAGAVGHALVGVLGPLFIMRSMFGTLGGAVVQRFAAGVVGALGRARLAVMAFNLSMLANPVVLGVAAAVAAVAVVGLVVRKYWQPISAFFTGLGQALGEAFGPALRSMGAALAPLKPAWDAVAGAVSGFFGWLGRLLQPMQATQGQIDGATNAGRQFGRMLVTAFNVSPIGMMVTAVRIGFAAIRTVMAWRPAETLRAAWSGIGALFTELRARFVGFGRSIIQGLISGIVSAGAGVGRAIVSTASGAVTSFRNRLGIRSPSRVFAGLGADTMAGLALGLVRGAPAAIGAVAAAGAGMAQALPAIAASATLSAATGALPAAPSVAAGGGGARPSVVIERLEQHFHLPPGTTSNPRELARELARLSAAGQRRAMNDGELS